MNPARAINGEADFREPNVIRATCFLTTFNALLSVPLLRFRISDADDLALLAAATPD